MKLPDNAVMPVVSVIDGRLEDHSLIARFYGPDCYTRSVEFISTLPEYREGRYGLDFFNMECNRCSEISWLEAWDEPDHEHLSCPNCHRVFLTEDAMTMHQPIPELES